MLKRKKSLLTAVIVSVLAICSGASGEVINKPVTSIEVTRQPSRATYGLDEDIDLSGIQVHVTFIDGTDATVGAEDLEVQGFQKGVAGSQLVAVKYGTNPTTITVTVKEEKVTQIRATLKGSAKYWVGDVVMPNDIVVMGTLDVGGTREISNFEMTPQKVVAGTNTIEVGYGELKSQITFTGFENTLQDIQFESEGKKRFMAGENFSSEGLKVVAKYAKGNTLDITNRCELEVPDLTKPGRQYVKVKFEGRELTYSVDVERVIFERLDTSEYNENKIVKLYFRGFEEPVVLDESAVYKIDNSAEGTRTLKIYYLGQVYEDIIELPEEDKVYNAHKIIVGDVPIRLNLVTDNEGKLGYFAQTPLAAEGCKLKLKITPRENPVVEGLPLELEIPEYMSLSIPSIKYNDLTVITLDTILEVLE